MASRFSLWLIAGLVLGLGGWANPARAQTYEQFPDRESFLSAAVNELPEIDFEELEDLDEYQTLEYPGVVFHSTDGEPADLKLFSPDVISLPALQSRVLVSNRNWNPMVLEFSPSVTAVGLEVLSLPSGHGVTVLVEGSEESTLFTVPLSNGSPAFFGVIARAGAIHRVTIANPEGVTQFIAVDNVACGQVPADDPVLAGLEALDAAIREGQANGSIRGLGRSLQAKVAAAREAWENGLAADAGAHLRALDRQVSAQTGKRIHPDRAALLRAWIEECLARMAD